MCSKIILMLLVAYSSDTVHTRMLPKFSDLDTEDHELLRAAYDTPSYDHEEEEEDLHLGKVDLVKDGLWALKAKMKELKAFDKALLAHVLATKLQVKEMLKKQPHFELVKDKKHHHHAAPSYQQHYEAPHASYQQHYEAPQASYQQQSHYEAPQTSYGSSQHYEAPQSVYAAPYQPQQPPQYTHDPYYGH